MTLSVYLSAPYSARKQAQEYASELTDIGYQVRCRWLGGGHELGDDETPSDETKAVWAREDFADIDAANVVVMFTARNMLLQGLSGGRHVEMGYALAKRKQVIVVGSAENIFHSLPQVTRVETWHAALRHLAARLVRHEREMAKPARDEEVADPSIDDPRRRSGAWRA